MKIVLLGRFPDSKILSGPHKFASELLNNLLEFSESLKLEVWGIDYFFKDLDNSSFTSRLLGKELLNFDRHIIRMGWIRIIYFLISFKPDILHVVSAERYITYILFFRRVFSGKMIVTFHSSLKYELRNRKLSNIYIDLLLERVLLKKTDQKVFVSHLLYKLFVNLYDNEINSYSVLYMGNMSDFKHNNEDKWDKINNYNFVFYSGFDSSIDRGLDFILKVFTELEDERFTLHIIGSINNKTEIRPHVLYYPMIDPGEFCSFFNDKHFIIKSPAFDSFAIFVLETMNYLVIPIINKNTGMSEILVNNENGFIYDSQRDLMTLFQSICDNSFDLKSMAIKAKIIANEYSWIKTTKTYIEEYENLIKK